MTMNLDKLKVCAGTIKETVSAADVGRVLGLEMRKNRCKCPIHHGDGYNCVLFRDERGFYCHVCHASGDCISLVQEVVFGGRKSTFVRAVAWLNDSFHLGMDIDSPVDETQLKQAKNRLKRKAEKRQEQERLRAMSFEMYLACLDALRRAEEVRDKNRPERDTDGWNKAFADAVEVIPIINQFADYFEMESRVVK